MRVRDVTHHGTSSHTVHVRNVKHTTKTGGNSPMSASGNAEAEFKAADRLIPAMVQSGDVARQRPQLKQVLSTHDPISRTYAQHKSTGSVH